MSCRIHERNTALIYKQILVVLCVYQCGPEFSISWAPNLGWHLSRVITAIGDILLYGPHLIIKISSTRLSVPEIKVDILRRDVQFAFLNASLWVLKWYESFLSNTRMSLLTRKDQ